MAEATSEAVVATEKLSLGSGTKDDPDLESRDEYLVKVKAQVMTRDDSSGGWVPTSGGGISLVGLRTLSSSSVDTQYLIDGQKVSDHTVTLSCVVKKELSYTKATPTFHHWRIQGERYGLTFHSSADAQVFEKCITKVAGHLREKYGEMTEETPEDQEVSQSSIPRTVKETVSLPGSRARTPSPASSMRITLQPTYAVPFVMYHPSSYPHLNMVCNRKPLPGHAALGGILSDPYGRSSQASRVRMALHRNLRRSSEEGATSVEPLPMPGSDGSYVQFSKTDLTAPVKDVRYDLIPHEYSYPMLESVGHARGLGGGGARTASQKSLDVPAAAQPSAVPLPQSKKSAKIRGADSRGRLHNPGQRLRCAYCREMFLASENRRGSCPDRTSGCLRTIEILTCVRCARGALYHLTADDDGDYGAVCVCDHADPRNRRKWVVMTVLSVVMPCLLCYPLAMACHRCSVRHGRCGARHKAE